MCEAVVEIGGPGKQSGAEYHLGVDDQIGRDQCQKQTGSDPNERQRIGPGLHRPASVRPRASAVGARASGPGGRPKPAMAVSSCNAASMSGAGKTTPPTTKAVNVKAHPKKRPAAVPRGGRNARHAWLMNSSTTL